MELPPVWALSGKQSFFISFISTDWQSLQLKLVYKGMYENTVSKFNQAFNFRSSPEAIPALGTIYSICFENLLEFS